MKRWRKQQRVNGAIAHSLKLRHFPEGEPKGVMVSLTLVVEDETTHNAHLSIEVDGDCVFNTEYDEYQVLLAAMELIQEAVNLVDPAKQVIPVKPVLRKKRTDFPL